jgi:hypothetical protein
LNCLSTIHLKFLNSYTHYSLVSKNIKEVNF